MTLNKRLNGMDAWGLLWAAVVVYAAYSTPAAAWESGMLGKAIHTIALAVGGGSIWWIGRSMVKHQ